MSSPTGPASPSPSSGVNSVHKPSAIGALGATATRQKHAPKAFPKPAQQPAKTKPPKRTPAKRK